MLSIRTKSPEGAKYSLSCLQHSFCLGPILTGIIIPACVLSSLSGFCLVKQKIPSQNWHLLMVNLIQTQQRIIPIEVKAEENVKGKSLSQFVTIDHADKQLKGLRCSMKPYIDQGWMENIPLFSILSCMNQQLQKEKYAP